MSENNSHRDPGGVDDSVVVKVKGPDQELWAWRDEWLEEHPQQAGANTGGVAIGEILNEGTDEEIKGPGPAWERDEEGRFINRD